MMFKQRKYLLSLALAILVVSLFSFNIPQPINWVSDYTGLISEQTKTRLNQAATELKQKTGVEIGIAIFPSIGDWDENYAALKVFETWKIGSKNDEGVLILIAVKERRIKIETGYGAEPYITDAFSGNVYRAMKELLPKGQERWDEAVSTASNLILGRIAKEKNITLTGVPEYQEQSAPVKNIMGVLILIVVFIFLMIVTKGKILEVLIWALILSGRGGGGGFGGMGGGSNGGGGFGGFGGFGGGRSGGGGAGGGF